MNREIVINACYGGYTLSDKALELLKSKKNTDYIYTSLLSRDDSDLIEVVKLLGEDANGLNCKLKIIQIPVEVDWQICDYDGYEWVAEKHRTWS